METSSSPPPPAVDLFTEHFYQLVYTLTDLLPPPADDTPEALSARNHAAIAKVAALLPVNANEADLAAQCIAARGQAEEMLRLLRQHAGDIGLVMRLNAQYGSMVRTSLSIHGRLMRVQALRRKREAIVSAANEDVWALHMAEQSMLAVVDPKSASLEAASPAGAPDVRSPKAAPVATPVEAPAACLDQKAADSVSETSTNSQQAAFETLLSAQPWNATGSSETNLIEVVRAAIAKSRSAKRESPANRRQSSGPVDQAGRRPR